MWTFSYTGHVSAPGIVARASRRISSPSHLTWTHVICCFGEKVLHSGAPGHIFLFDKHQLTEN